MMIGNIAQNGIRNRYRNQPTPGVMMPTIVNRPMMPKMKQPSRIRIGHGGSSGSSIPAKLTLPPPEDAGSAAGSAPPSSRARIASTPACTPPS